ncbi:hypothetical protein L211DRAFT_853383 [Terfezia boudieri ATCC MYA-4762]|uniref:Glucose-methanol-choline oxidoreductase N-terminal domain-containing protein n=1 Tax=Terfezia boudieri ATCC MYA-4762 TaxID=1051890 RepID=A0A3N4LCT0_9PEZI|nr:hypothetical protein L211DRAFT_853383 [Terfezia boudieri ATCC MYA-4762]
MGTMNSWLVDASLAGARFADKVIISSGSLHSPALLLRSQLTNPHIGARLAPQAPIHPQLGSVISTETANLSPAPFNSYGTRIEAGYMFPLVRLAQLPSLSGEKFKNRLASPYSAAYATPSDRDSLIEGLVVAGQVLLTTGAS